MTDSLPTVREALAEGARRLSDRGIPDAVGDSRRLLAHALGISLARLTVRLDDPVEAGAPARYDELLRRRAEGREPVSHLIGSRMFWGREFRVTRDVLDPRPETETLVACVLEAPFQTVLDLGTGSGCLLATLLAERPQAHGLGTDLSDAALAIAQENAHRLGVEARAAFKRADWLEGVEGTFDVIVSNPPYIAEAEVEALQPEVRDHEPRMALTPGGDGLGAYRVILREAPSRLAPGGRLAVEVGAGQAEAVLALGRDAGWAAGETRADLDGRARVCLFREPGAPAAG